MIKKEIYAEDYIITRNIYTALGALRVAVKSKKENLQEFCDEAGKWIEAARKEAEGVKSGESDKHMERFCCLALANDYINYAVEKLRKGFPDSAFSLISSACEYTESAAALNEEIINISK